MTTQETIIPVSRKKLVFLTLGALLFVLASLFIIKRNTSTLELSSILGMILGSVCLLFFGICFLFGIFRLLDQRPGVVLTGDGFVERASILGGHFIRWKDVEGLTYLQVQKQMFICVLLKDPEAPINQSKGIQRIAMRLKRFYGSPIHISANSLACSFSELQQLFKQAWERSRVDATHNTSF